MRGRESVSGRGGDATAGRPHASTDSARQIRGSAVLLSGRFIAIFLQAATQILIVRLLTKSDFGAFAYALALTETARHIITFGHGQVVSRFFSLYDEERAYDKLMGALVMELATFFAAGVFLFAAVVGLRDVLAGRLIDDPRAISLLAVLILLAPLETFDRVFEALLAVFGKARAVAFRRYVLTPSLRLLVVLLLFATTPSVTLLAAGFVAAGVVGVVAYVHMSIRVLREQQISVQLRKRGLVFPFREIWGFALPMFHMQLVSTGVTTLVLVLLGYFGGTGEVASFRAVFPAARFNEVVYFTFSLLFLPLASRLFARGDVAGMRRAYWETAVWLAVFSFPIFALTVPLAEPTTVLLFGERYRESASVLALLSFGMYFNAAFGFNSLTLRAYGKVRHLLVVNTAAALTTAGLAVALVPRYGAVGAAIPTAAGLVLQNTLNQFGLKRQLDLPLFELSELRVYVVIAGMAIGLALLQLLVSPHPILAVAAALVASATVLLASRDRLNIAHTFPEIRRVPVIRRFVAR